jgi:hypothetical protein
VYESVHHVFHLLVDEARAVQTRLDSPCKQNQAEKGVDGRLLPQNARITLKERHIEGG